jgi:hypothetical protein
MLMRMHKNPSHARINSFSIRIAATPSPSVKPFHAASYVWQLSSVKAKLRFILGNLTPGPSPLLVSKGEG